MRSLGQLRCFSYRLQANLRRGPLSVFAILPLIMAVPWMSMVYYHSLLVACTEWRAVEATSTK